MLYNMLYVIQYTKFYIVSLCLLEIKTNKYLYLSKKNVLF